MSSTAIRSTERKTIFFILSLSTLEVRRDISGLSNRAESLQSAGFCHSNLDRRFCLGQRRFHDAGAESDARDSLSDFVTLDTNHVSGRPSLFVAQSQSNQ